MGGADTSPTSLIVRFVEFSGIRWIYTALNKGGCALRDIVIMRLAGSHAEYVLVVASC
jgi:hypothetical protein